jgi:hypothetical protein
MARDDTAKRAWAHSVAIPPDAVARMSNAPSASPDLDGKLGRINRKQNLSDGRPNHFDIRR